MNVLSIKLKRDGYTPKELIYADEQRKIYSLDNQRVLKITKSEVEAKAMSIIKNGEYLNLVRVYRVWTYKDIPELYFIEQEKLKESSKRLIELWMTKNRYLDGKVIKLCNFIKQTDSSSILNNRQIIIDTAKTSEEKEFIENMLDVTVKLKKSNVDIYDCIKTNIFMIVRENMKIKYSELRKMIFEEKKKLLYDDSEVQRQENIKELLKKYKASSVSELDDEKKKKFFNELNRM